MFYNNAKKEAIAKAKTLESRLNEMGEQANDLAIRLYSVRKSAALAIERVEDYINILANTPKEFKRDVAQVKIDIQEFNDAVRIEEENSSHNLKGATSAVGGVVAGGVLATMGPSAAMAIATTFGTASTGTAISALSGAAATNAALAWLGGGTLATGGGGIAAGNAFLALAGPVGWGIAGTLAVAGGLFAAHKNKKAAEEAIEYAKETQSRIAVLQPKLTELYKLTLSTEKLLKSLHITKMVQTFPKDYLKFAEEQKEELVALINHARAMGELINKRIS